MLKYKFIKPKKRNRIRDPFAIQTGQFKDGKLKPLYRPGWSEDAYIADSQEKETVGRNFNFSKLPVLAAGFIFFLFLLLARTAWLQIVKGDYYYEMAEGNRVRIERLEPKRGIIYDRFGRPLVRNKANFLLYFVPADLPAGEELNKIITAVSDILGPDYPVEKIKEKLKKIKKNSLVAYQPLFIADNIPYQEAMRLYLFSWQWPGVVLSSTARREYLNHLEGEPEPTYSLSHILGYTGKITEEELEKFGQSYLPIDYIGKMGIEYFWENELRGENGRKQIEVDALGKEKKVLREEPAQDGHNLVLSLDVVAQAKLEEIFRAHLRQLKLNRGVAVVMNPQNGEILALVSLPAYDNNLFARGISTQEFANLMAHKDKPLFNRAISGEYPSGSTIKPIIAAAALEEGIITEHTTINSVGGIRIGQWFFPDWLPGGHGLTDVRRAIAQSINTFFYYVGGGYNDFRGLGVEKIDYYAELFGLGKQTGIDLAGEASGFLPTPEWKKRVKGERWYIGDTYHLSIGQGDLLVTPLQIAAATAVFANGGQWYRPHLIKEILDSNDRLVRKMENIPVRENFINAYNIQVVRQGMRQAVTAGSARRLQSLPVAAAGKTGTAQWSKKYQPHAWFTGFAPYKHPEIVITVLVEEGGEGHLAAVPIAEEFLQWYFSEYKPKTE